MSFSKVQGKECYFMTPCVLHNHVLKDLLGLMYEHYHLLTLVSLKGLYDSISQLGVCDHLWKDIHKIEVVDACVYMKRDQFLIFNCEDVYKIECYFLFCGLLAVKMIQNQNPTTECNSRNFSLETNEKKESLP